MDIHQKSITTWGISLHTKTKLRLLAVSATAVLAAPIPLGHALANTTSNRVKPGAACETVGATGTHRGDVYECREVTPGCKLWKYAGPVTGEWTGGPAKCCTPKPGPSATSPSSAPASPSRSASINPAPSTTATATVSELPITGPNVPALVAGGLFLLIVGGVVVAVVRRRNP